MIGLCTPVHHIGRGCGVPNVADVERCVKIKPGHSFIVHIDGLIYEIEIIGRLIRQLYCGFVAILKIECRDIFLLQDVVELCIVLNIGLQFRIADNGRVIVYVTCASMQLPIGRIDTLSAEIKLEDACWCSVVSSSKLRYEIPVMLILAVIVFSFCRNIERQAPVKRSLRPEIETCYILVETVVKVVIVRRTVGLRAMIFRSLVFGTVIECPFPDIVFLIQIDMIAVDALPAVRVKQKIGVFEKCL